MARSAPPKRVSLPVLKASRPTPRLRRWRVATLIGVHLLILAHIAHWLITGYSISPAVMSDSMKTLEAGQVTCGVLVFGAAIIVSLLFGRFLCGWACHMGALQDLCAWALGKLGHRPPPFRARWLGLAPTALALYMFVWPTFRRELLAPVLQHLYPDALAWIGPWHAFPGLTNHLMTEDFWNGLPTRWYVAVPFLLVCGVASVYFLGSRALCRYGCPYAGLLDPAEKLAPVSVVVDPALCDRCGLCTASCSVGVRVMDEVNRYGSIVNSRCVRSLDCVSVCPQHALSLGFTTPAAIKSLRGQRAINSFSLSLAEEATATGAGLATFFAARGAYGLIPMLMAVGLSICTAAAAVACLRLLSAPNVRFLGAQLKRADAVRPAGCLVLALFLGWCILLAQAATVQVLHRRAAAIMSRAVIAPPPSTAGNTPSSLDPTLARRALDIYRLAGPLSDGGIALLSTPGADAAAARLLLASGQALQAARTARRAIDRDDADDDLARLYAAALAEAQGPTEATAWLLRHVDTHPRHADSRRAVVDALIADGRFDDAVALLDRLASRETRRGSVHAELARLLIADGRTAPALAAIRKAAALSPADRAIATDAVAIEAIGGNRAACARAIDRLRPLAGDALSEQLAALGSVLDGQGLSRAAQVLADAQARAATTSGSSPPGPPAH